MDELFVFVTLRNYDKYKGRKDVQEPRWFQCSTKILDDDDFADLTGAQMCAWLHILVQAKTQKSASVRINLEKVDALRRKFSREDLIRVIELMKERGPLLPDGEGAGDSRTRSVRNPYARRTEKVPPEERRGEEIREEEKESAAGAEPPPAEASPQGKILPELAGISPAAGAALAETTLDFQEHLVGMYEIKWLRASIARAVVTLSGGGPVNWQKRLGSWFVNEKRPKFKPTERPPRAPREKRAHSATPLGDIISADPNLRRVAGQLGLKVVKGAG